MPEEACVDQTAAAPRPPPLAGDRPDGRRTTDDLRCDRRPDSRRIIELLDERERSVGELVIELQMAHAAVSTHLRTLREAGVTGVRADGRRRWYTLRAAPLEELGSWLGRFGDRDVGL